MATLKILREKFGGPEGYITERCGLTKEEVDRVRANFIVETPPILQNIQHNL